MAGQEEGGGGSCDGGRAKLMEEKQEQDGRCKFLEEQESFGDKHRTVISSEEKMPRIVNIIASAAETLNDTEVFFFISETLKEKMIH